MNEINEELDKNLSGSAAEQTANACRANEQNEIRILPVFLSSLIPGIGQFVQRRYIAGLCFLAVFGFTVLPLYHCCWNNYQGSFTEILINLIIVAVVPLLVIYLAMFDSLLWQKNGKTHFKSPIIWVPLCLFTLLLLYALAVPAAHKAAFQMTCNRNMKMIAFAVFCYHEEHKHYPPAYTVDKDGKPLHSWRVLLLPYMNLYEDNELYKQIRLDEPWDSDWNRQFHSKMPHLFRCPLQYSGVQLCASGSHIKIPPGCCYSLVTGRETAFDGSQTCRKSDVQDGTVFLVERAVPVNWMQPDNDIPFAVACKGINKEINGIGSYHSGNKVYAATLNGNVVTLAADKLPLETLKALLTKDNNDPVKDTTLYLSP